MSATAAAAPRILDGRWALPAEFRHGASARVYRATDLDGEFDGPVAVKVMQSSIKGDAQLAAMLFDREQRTLQRLDHPNVVPLLGGGRDTDTEERYFVFPWLERDLRAVLREAGPIAWERWWPQYGRPLVLALAYAHDQDVAHRDLKPGNVLIGADGVPLLADFGIAKHTEDVNLGPTLLGHGTPPYKPRNYEDERFNMQRDVHAFAALCVVAVTGVDPHAPGADPYAVLDGALAELTAMEDVYNVLCLALQEDAERRPPNAGMLLASFDRCASLAPDLPAPILHLQLSPKARDVLVDELDLSKATELEQALLRELSDELSLVPFERPFSDGTPSDGHYHLLGGELKLHCKVIEPNRDALLVVNGWRMPASLVEREQARGVLLPVRLGVGGGKDRAAAARLVAELEQAAHESQAEQRRADRAEARSAPLRTWRRILQAARGVLKELERPVPYKDLRARPNGEVEFELAGDGGEAFVDEPRIEVVTDDDLPALGEVLSITDRRVRVRPLGSGWSAVAASGELRVDTTPARIALRRQEAALDALRYGRAHRPALRELLTDPSTVREPEPVDIDAFTNSDLDQPKRDAVAAALGAEDLLLVEGPPGTGKTTFITELILAEIRRRPDIRILLAAQTHAALDNVLERVAEAADVKMLRIARDDETRVAEGTKDLLVGAQVERWRRSGIRQGEQWLKRWAAEHGLDVAAVETAVRLDELAAAMEHRRRLARERTVVEQRLEELRRLRRDDPDSTDADALRAMAEQLEDLVEQLGAARDDEAGLAKRLAELGGENSDELRKLTPAHLRERARAMLPDDTSVFRRARELLALLGDWHARLGRSPEFRAAALLRAQVVAATCVGYAGVRGAESVEFDLCIVDEASKATATELLVPMTRARRWILVGDHRQLPPFIDDALERSDLLADHRLSREDLHRTLFDELRTKLPEACRTELTQQHRMLPAIGRLISDVFYGGALTSAERQTPVWVSAFLGAPVVWCTTAGSAERAERRDGRSLRNPHEGRCIRALLRRLDFYAGADKRQLKVAVLSGYRNQVAHMRRLFADDESQWSNLEVTVSTVDAFQGREADVTLYSVTRSNPLGEIGFLRERRRLNVALSRGRDLIVIVGDHITAGMRGGENPLREVLEHIESHEAECSLQEAVP